MVVCLLCRSSQPVSLFPVAVSREGSKRPVVAASSGRTDDGMDVGGTSTSTPAAQTGAPAGCGGDGAWLGGQQEIGGGGGGGDGSAAEEMDRDGGAKELDGYPDQLEF